MSWTVEQLLEYPCTEQIRYVQCGLCSTILLVNVPYRNLYMVVSVRCGNCTALLSVNMANPSFDLSNNLAKDMSFHDFNLQKQQYSCAFDNNASVTSYAHNIIIQNHEVDVDDDDDVLIIPPTRPLVNKLPEKKQRAPSAYNQFIKEEIRRLKAENPAMAHKEAFKTAAKNWAHIPPVNGEGDRMKKKNAM